MSSNEHHEPFIKNWKQFAAVCTVALLGTIFIIIILASGIASSTRSTADIDAYKPESIAARIKPVAMLEIKGAPGSKPLKAGAEVYAAQCSACHAAGVAGSPKFGDNGAWAARIKTGYEALLTSALKGKGSMAAQGGGDYEDAEIGRAVIHMANASGGKFEEPKAAAPVAAAPAPAK